MESPESLSSAWQRISNMTFSFQVRLNETLDRRMQGPIPPNAILTITFPKSLTRKQIRVLAIASWTWGSAGYLIREEIRERLVSRNRFDDFDRLILLSKEGASAYLGSSYSERDFYGNFTGFLESALQRNFVQVSLKRQPRSRRKIRRRGYRDQGTLRPDRQYRNEELKDESLRELQIQEEEKREILENLFISFWGWADPTSSRVEVGHR